MSKCLLWGEETRKECAEYRDKGHEECAEYQDKGYNACAQYKDQGYNACASWSSRCCDWWPCSWLCELVTWFCIAWYWVSNIVCVAWYWVSNIVCVAWYWIANVVCVAWTWVTSAVCLLWEVVVTVVGFIFETLIAVAGLILNVLGVLIEAILSIPIVGRLLKELWTIGTEVFWRIVGLGDAVAWAIGIRPEKKLRMRVIILSDEKGTPVADPAHVMDEVQAAASIFRSQANVRLLPATAYHVTTPFVEERFVGESFVHTDTTPRASNLLDLRCGIGAWGEDLLDAGPGFNLLMASKGFWDNTRRLLGYGAPITVFVVRSINQSSTTGCSMGPAADYVTVVGTETADDTTIAHETGHACGLWHDGSPTNLMYSTDSNDRRNMTSFQAINFRNSKHVTYF